MEDVANYFDYLDYVAVIIGGILGYFFGGVDGLLQALLAFTILDYITGMIAAWSKKVLSSNIGFKGIARKVTIFALVGVAHIVDKELLAHIEFFGNTDILRDAVLCFYLANEGLSIIENAITIGIPVPNFFKEKLLQFKNSSNKKGLENKNNEEA